MKKSRSARVAEVLQRHIAASKARMAFAERAKALGVSASALYAWINGNRIPRGEFLEKIATHLYPNDLAAKERFLKEMDDAAEQDRGPGSPSDSVPARIRAGVIEYGGFSGLEDDHHGFVVEFFKRFAAFAGKEIADPLTQDRSLSASGSPLLQGDVDVTLGLLATVDRTTSFDFVLTPARIGLNAVTPPLQDNERNELRDALKIKANAQDRRQFVRQFAPIAHPMEVGGLYLEKTLKIGSDEIQPIDVFDIKVYAEAFRRQLTTDRDRRPVIVADELTCMRVLEKLGGTATLAYDLVGCDEVPTATFPMYPVGLAVDHRRAEWSSYLRESIDLHLRTDPAGVATLYHLLFLDLKKQAKEAIRSDSQSIQDEAAIEEKAGGWAKRTLGLCDNAFAVVAPEWRPILDLTNAEIAQKRGVSRTVVPLAQQITDLRTEIQTLTASVNEMKQTLTLALSK